MASPQAASVLGWMGQTIEVQVLGRRFDVWADVDQDEVGRRALAGPVLDHATLRALMSLPWGVPVAWKDLDAETSIVLKLAPPETVESEALWVTRTFRPAIELVGLLLADPVSQHGLNEISLFASVAPRAAYGTRSTIRRLEPRARKLGIGLVALHEAESCEVVVPTTRHVRPGVVRWRFQELCFGAWLHEFSRQPARH